MKYKRALLGVGAVATWELAWWYRRYRLRQSTFACAAARAVALNRPLVVIGAPDRGSTAGYPCGDITVDIGPSACPRSIQADITKAIPVEDNSAVVFVACTLEYVSNFSAAWAEIRRVAGDTANVFNVRVEPWTLTAWLYPGRRRTLPVATLPTTCG